LPPKLCEEDRSRHVKFAFLPRKSASSYERALEKVTLALVGTPTCRPTCLARGAMLGYRSFVEKVDDSTLR
jgi:hypothetical protein